MMTRSKLVKIIALLILIATALILVIKLTFWLKPESTAYSRISKHNLYSCMNCHAQGANAKVDDWSLDCNKKLTHTEHPHYQQSCRDLQNYFIILSLREDFKQRFNASNGKNRLIQAEQLARQNYCFQCHGELGQGGVPNQDALKSYIPGYFGNDFKVLTQNGNEKAVKEWITTGSNSQLVNDPIWGFMANFFLKRQHINMPSFNSFSAQQLELLTHYVITINQLGPLDKTKLKQYNMLTQEPE